MKRALLACSCALALLGCSGDSKLVDPDAGSSGGVGGAGSGGRSGAPAGMSAGGAGASGRGGTGGTPNPSGLTLEELLTSECSRGPQLGVLLPANLLFVLDRSLSMQCNPPPTTDSATCEREGTRATGDVETKWEITQKAIVEALNIVPSDSFVGLSYFSNDDGCGVQAEPTVPMRKNSPVQKDLIRTSLERSVPNGPTPLVGATILAYQYLYNLALEGSIRGNNFVVLLTDGKQSETCGDPGRCTTAAECTNLLITQEVPKAAGQGVWIRTFVIGVPGSEADSRTLSLIAHAGRTPRPGCDKERDCHFDISRGGDFSADLRQALQNIVGQARSCDLPAPAPADQDRVNVIFSPSNEPRRLLLQDERPCDGGTNTGWQYVDGKRRIRVCGATCSALQSDPDAQLQVVLGCPIQGPQ